MSDSTANASIVDAWNTILFEKFCRYERLLTEGLGQHGSKLFEAHPPQPGWRVLDVGSGFGDTTIQLAKLVGDKGAVFGVDCAANFIKAAGVRAAKAGESRVEFLCRDVQCDDLGGPYDAAYSRFGTMFFNSPVMALKNVRASLAPGGRLFMTVWRKRQDNPCFYVAQQVVERFIDDSDKATDQITCGPGPFSMAGTDMVSDQLMAAGFDSISFQRFDAPMCVGDSIDEALRFARDIGPAGEALRLASEKAAHLSQDIEAALREAFEAFEKDGALWATSSTWLISARAAA